MFRNHYDTDITTWSPQGRLHQVEYAMEAVKQGSAVVGLRSKSHVVLATLKRASSDLSSYQKKIFKVDEHMGIAIAGLTADARKLCRWMRLECLNHQHVFESNLPVGRMVDAVGDKCQVCTQRSSSRPYGVGLLVAGYDQTGPHLFQTCPSGNYFEYKAMAIGARSQAARTYFEKNYEQFEECDLGALIKHGLTALAAGTQGDLTTDNCALAYVGSDNKFTVIEDDLVQPYIDLLEQSSDAPAAAAAPEAQAMETS